MPSSQEFLTYILDSLSGLSGITYRKMMGEYMLYYDGRLFGGVYDDRFLVKAVPAAETMLPDAPRELPYPQAKPMLLIEETDDRAMLAALIPQIAAQVK